MAASCDNVKVTSHDKEVLKQIFNPGLPYGDDVEEDEETGLRDLICFGRSESPKKAAKSSAQRSLEYRQRFTPEELEEYRVQARERAYKQYHKMLDEEEKAARREASRLRSKQYRDRKKAERSSGPLATSTPKPKTRKAIGEQRQLWREQKKQQRSQWGPQKKRRHREKSLAYYYTKKASSEEVVEDSENVKRAKELEIQGVKAAEAGNIDSAIELFGQAVTAAPEWPSAYNNRAQALRLKGDIEGARADLDKAIELSEGKGTAACQAFTQRGLIKKREGDDDGAREDLQKAANLGNGFAKQLLAAMNPYAALCNQMLCDVMHKLRSGEPGGET